MNAVLQLLNKLTEYLDKWLQAQEQKEFEKEVKDLEKDPAKWWADAFANGKLRRSDTLSKDVKEAGKAASEVHSDDKGRVVDLESRRRGEDG